MALAVERHDVLMRAALADIDKTWRAIGLDAEGMARSEAYLAAFPEDQLRLRARLSSVLSYLLWSSGHKVRAFELATEAVEQARAERRRAVAGMGACAPDVYGDGSRSA
jgi:hypothetical protein